jgi:hypothetical protein
MVVESPSSSLTQIAADPPGCSDGENEREGGSDSGDNEWEAEAVAGTGTVCTKTISSALGVVDIVAGIHGQDKRQRHIDCLRIQLLVSWI